MIFARIKQGFTYLFSKYKVEYDIEVQKILTQREFLVFSKMDEYDKVHSYKLMKKVLKDDILKDNLNYIKLALLHDCGKENASLFKRIKKVLIGDKVLDIHPENSYQKLKDINIDVANLASLHHKPSTDLKMKRFQMLDDK